MMKMKSKAEKMKNFWNNLEYWQKIVIAEVIIIILVSLVSFPFFRFIFNVLGSFIFDRLYTGYSVGAILFGAFGGLFFIVLCPVSIAILICYYLLVRKNKVKSSRLTLIGLYSLSSFLAYFFDILRTSQFDLLKALEFLSRTRTFVWVGFIIFMIIINLIPSLWKQE